MEEPRRVFYKYFIIKMVKAIRIANVTKVPVCVVTFDIPPTYLTIPYLFPGIHPGTFSYIWTDIVKHYSEKKSLESFKWGGVLCNFLHMERKTSI